MKPIRPDTTAAGDHLAMSPVTGDPFDAFEAAGWEAAADTYDAFFGPITDRLIDPVLDATEVTVGTRLLDVACGPGHLVAMASTCGARPVGVDVSPAMVGRARAAHPGLELSNGDAHRLPFPDATFDVVIANFAIMHLSHPERAVAEFGRVLAPGGRVAFTVWDHPERARLFGWVLEALDAAGADASTDAPAGPAFFRFATDDELHTLLATTGFTDVTVTTRAFSHPAPSAAVIWSGIVDGTVRTSALIQRQAPAVQQAIRSAFDEIVTDAIVDGVVEIPFSVKVATATSPATTPEIGLPVDDR